MVEVDVEPRSWLTRGPRGELALDQEGVVVLGIVRKSGEYLGAPTAKRQIKAGDRVVVYGRTSRILELRQRSVVDRAAHERAKEKHRAVCALQP